MPQEMRVVAQQREDLVEVDVLLHAGFLGRSLLHGERASDRAVCALPGGDDLDQAAVLRVAATDCGVGLLDEGSKPGTEDVQRAEVEVRGQKGAGPDDCVPARRAGRGSGGVHTPQRVGDLGRRVGDHRGGSAIRSGAEGAHRHRGREDRPPQCRVGLGADPGGLARTRAPAELDLPPDVACDPGRPVTQRGEVYERSALPEPGHNDERQSQAPVHHPGGAAHPHDLRIAHVPAPVMRTRDRIGPRQRRPSGARAPRSGRPWRRRTVRR